METEIINKQSVLPGPNGGARPGAGRPPGKLTDAVIFRNAAMKVYKHRVALKTGELLDAQMANAMGNIYLFRIDDVEKTDKDGKKYTMREHILVEDKDEIKEVIEETDGEGGTVGDEYYYITTKKPDNKAIDSILDRTYGKAQTNIDLTSAGEKVFMSPKTVIALDSVFNIIENGQPKP